MKKILALVLVLILIFAIFWGSSRMLDKKNKTATDIIKISELNSDEKEKEAYLASSFDESAAYIVSFGEDIPDCYSFMPDDVTYGPFPEKFDLREADLVTPVKSQEPWGTCWSFGTISAAETSILSSLNMTQTQFEEKYGQKMDLSEKHLAYFTALALPDTDDYEEGKYPYDAGQAGEGSHAVAEDSVYDFGGNYFLSTSVMASGIGPVNEEDYPYEDANGGLDAEGDWSLAESSRFISKYNLVDANVLPSPANRDGDGYISYNPLATDMIKAEMMRGRAVGISFGADQSYPARVQYEYYKELLGAEEGLDEKLIETYAQYRAEMITADDLSYDEILELVKFRLEINGYEKDFFDLTDLQKEDLATLCSCSYFYETLEETLAQEKPEQYMSFGEAEDGSIIWAQYTYDDEAEVNHAVCAVGWDDTFPKEFFPEGKQPPADGAWIVKNSWGTDWGMDGYFYLSYYDKTLEGCESFEFKPMETQDMSILENDLMPVQMIDSTLFDEPVYSANIFTTEIDGVPQYVSVLTSDMNTEFTVSLYLLNDKSTSPIDGILLDTVTSTAEMAGYHRVQLGKNVYVPNGSKIGVQVIERVETNEGLKYALVNTISLSKGYADMKNAETEGDSIRYCVGKINPGESYISFDHTRWIDWSEEIDNLYSQGGNFDYVSYDNLPIKVFSYRIEDVESMHTLSEKTQTPGGQASVCPECGYVLVKYDDVA